MRRTYRSKKDCGNALDHRDVIQNLDEEASVFDAFYIDKIKQTKRERSCFGSTNQFSTINNKVLKRKYVKRIAKEAERTTGSSGESLTSSAFLTPDKSIRVNKVYDLFDQLLNSSSPTHTKTPVNNRTQFKRYKVQGNTYSRKKLSQLKKFNCSSSDSYDSDKENSNKSHDTTDIGTHKLLIEVQKPTSSKYIDESINNIVQKMTILNNMRCSRNSSASSIPDSINTYQDHRLTTNLASPVLSKSPLCSTPFKEKYRSQSIYKFSPIGIGKNEDSPNYITIAEESVNDDVIGTDKKTVLRVEDYTTPSPIIHLSVNKSKKYDKNSKTASKLNLELSLIKDAISTSCKNSIDDNIKNNEVISIDLSDLHATEVEPFKGFTNSEILENSVVNKNYNDSAKEENDEFCQNEIDNTIYDLSSDNQETEDYDTCNSDQSFKEKALNDIRIPVVNIERLDNSIVKKYYAKLSNYNEQEEESSGSESDHYASFESIACLSNSNDCSNDSNESILEESNQDITKSLKEHLGEICTSQNILNNSNVLYLENDDMEYAYNSNTIEDSITSTDNDCTTNEKEDRCISFVTTRRRNEVTNDSMLLGFNDSLNSTSSADCDKTIISNGEIGLKVNLSCNLEVKIDHNSTVETNAIKFQHNHESNSERDALALTDKCYDTNKQATKRFSSTYRDSDIPSSSEMNKFVGTETEVKPAIVLQPGKKWERSLSIYRRMTMTDNFDHSILEDEDLQTKGRKYRQSVISTMEMQDLKGSLHNESIISRRSTFVSKPSRSTIRIIKEPNSSRLSLCTSTLSEDLKGFLSEDCDDTAVELSKLSIADSEHEVTVLENFHDTSNRISTARDYVLRRCNQTDSIHFDECYPETVLKNCRKIGEGVYGEVFLWRARDGRARVMKIVPIAGTTKVNGEHQKDFHEIISEIVIAMELSALRAPIDEIQRDFDEGKTIDALDLHSVENATDVFNEVLAVRCVFGAYPSRLLDLWELYDECNGSENDNPAILPIDQQYIVLELANAGQDLESFVFNNAEQAHALFLQVAFGLAVGEEAFQFEHRDLHWGNVLISPTDQKFAVFVLRGRAHQVARCGVAGTVIDYSLSRLSLALGGERAALYNDLATDEGLFDAVGDRQFEVYRLMRDKLGNDWKNFEPYTNILWLHYTVDKMITALRYKRTNTKIHKHYIAKLKGIKNRILDYGSAVQFVLTDNEF